MSYEGTGYGPIWKSRRPPGLPASARLTSSAAVGRAAVVAAIQRLGFASLSSGWFERVILGLAQSESGSMLGRPANSFDARPLKAADIPKYAATLIDGLRPGGSIVTAWGILQFNRGAWRSAVGSATAFPWEASAEQEVDVPLRIYARLWSTALSSGAAALDAARYIRLWHRSPVAAAKLLSAVRSGGLWSVAWAAVPGSHRQTVDRHLRSVGLV